MKPVYIFFGLLCVVLGAIGAVVPGLPTTPFLLVAIYCFSQGSERLHNWLVSTSLYKKYFKEFDENRTMTLKQKVTILAIAAPFTIFAFFTLPNIWGKIALVLAVIYQYYYFIFKIKTLEK